MGDEDRPVSGPGHAAGAESVERRFAWTPEDPQVVHPVVRAADASRYVVVIVAVLGVAAFFGAFVMAPASGVGVVDGVATSAGDVADGVATAVGGTIDAVASGVRGFDISLGDPFDGGGSGTAGVDNRTATQPATATPASGPTATPSPTAVTTPTPTPTPTPTSTPTPTPTPAPDSAHFAVSVDSTNSPVDENGTLSVTATIENTGDVTATQNVTLDVGGSQRDSATVDLASGDSTQVTLEWATGSGDAGDYQATVSSENTSDSTDVSVLGASNFDVSIGTTNSPVEEGQTLSVTAQIENTGDQQDTQTVTLDVGGSQRDSTTVELGSGESTQVTLEWTTGSGDGGDYTATVASSDNSAGASVTVLGPPHFVVGIDSTNSPVDEGETLSVTASVHNTGDQPDTQTVTLDVGGTQRDSTSIELAAGEERQVTLEWSTGSGDGGDYQASVSSENTTDSRGVSVLGPPNFDVSIGSTNSPVATGETLTVSATVENTGGQTDTQTVTLSIDGSQQDSVTVELNGGESDQVTLEWATGDGDAGDYTATVASEDDSADTGVDVREPVSIDSFSSSASCTTNILSPDEASLSVSWSTSSADSVTVTIINQTSGGTVDQYSGASGDETATVTGGCDHSYEFTIVASNEVSDASDSETHTAS